MNVKSIMGDVNYADIVATAEVEDPNLTPPEHIVNVARIAMTNPNMEVSDDVAEYVMGWIARQNVVWNMAADVIDRLEGVAPLPTPEQLVNGNPEWPEWMGTWWAATLRFHWAGRLSDAVAEAQEWLDAES